MLLIFSSCYQNLKNIWGKIDGSSIRSLIPFILFFVFICSFTIFHSAFALSSFIIFTFKCVYLFIHQSYHYSFRLYILSFFLLSFLSFSYPFIHLSILSSIHSSFHPSFRSFILVFILLPFVSPLHPLIHSCIWWMFSVWVPLVLNVELDLVIYRTVLRKLIFIDFSDILFF